jgi:hypothetical protein
MQNAHNRFHAVHLQMIRCARKINLFNFEKQDLRIFMLFDYFDVMLVQEETDKRFIEYEDCIAQSKLSEPVKLEQHVNIAARNYSTLIRPSDQPYSGDLFSGGRFDHQSYSSAPFLAVIMLTFLPDFIDSIQISDPDTVTTFLHDCIESIDEKACEVSKLEKTQIACFATLDIGHFTLVVRSSDPLAASKIAGELNKEETFSQCSHTYLHKMCFQTFTTQGMEMGLVWQKLNKSWVINKKQGYIAQPGATWIYDCLVVLRSANEKMARFIASTCKSCRTTLLSGRYHHSQRIPFAEYLEIYSDLCFYKFGYEESPPPSFIRVDLPEFSNAIAVLNERLLLPCEHIQEVSHTTQSYQTEIWDILQNRLNTLLPRQDLLPYGQGVFHEYCRLFHEIAATCASIFQFPDSCYNGTTIYMMMYIAIDAVDMYLNKLDLLYRDLRLDERSRDEINANIICDELLRSCGQFIDEILSLLKTVQTFSFQTLQSPHYGIQPGIDGEKYLMAANEFARRYYIHTTTLSPEIRKQKNNRGCKYCFPYFCIDHHLTGMTSANRFPPLDTDYCGRDALPVLLKTSVPNFQYFARIYDILPLTIHEVSHHIRFTKRKPRNDFFSTFVFSRISVVITRYWFVLGKKHENYSNDYLLKFRHDVIDSLCSALETSYIEYNKGIQKRAAENGSPTHSWKNLDMNDLVDNLTTFISQYVYYKPSIALESPDYEQEKLSNEKLKEIQEKLHAYSVMYENCRNSRILNDHINLLDRCIKKEEPYEVNDILREYSQLDIFEMVHEEFRVLNCLYPAALSSSDRKPSCCRQHVEYIAHEVAEILVNSQNTHTDQKAKRKAARESSLFKSYPMGKLAVFIVTADTFEHCTQTLEYYEEVLKKAWRNILWKNKDNGYLHELAQQAEIEISNCLKRIIDIRLLFDKISIFISSKSEIRTEQEKKSYPQNTFCALAAETLSNKLKSYFAQQSNNLDAYLMYDSDQLSRNLVLSLDSLQLKESLVKSCQSINEIEREELLEAARYCYEEVCADLCMCKMLKLNPLGCLYLYAKHDGRLQDISQVSSEENDSYERYNYVLGFLLLSSTNGKYVHDSVYHYAPAQALILALSEQIDQVTRLTIEFLLKSIPPSDVEDFRKVIEAAFEIHSKPLKERLMQVAKKRNIKTKMGYNVNKLQSISSEIHSLIQSLIKAIHAFIQSANPKRIPEEASQLLKELTSIYQIPPQSSKHPVPNNHTVSNIFNQWRHILICINYIFVNVVLSPYQSDDLSSYPSIRINIAHYEYFRKMYEVFENGNKQAKETTPQSDKTRNDTDQKKNLSNGLFESLFQEIGEYYNKYEIVINPDRKRDMLDWTFDYLLKYYYLHIFSLPKLFNMDNSPKNESALRKAIISYLGG